MNPIFKVTNGVYVDLSKIISIRMDVIDHMDNGFVLGELRIQYEKTPEQMMSVPSDSDFGQVKIHTTSKELYGSTLAFENLYYGEVSRENYKRSGGDPKAAIKDFRLKFEAKYKYVLDAWKQYKMYIELRIGFLKRK